MLHFQGARKCKPLHRESKENRNLGVKVQVFEGQLSGRVPNRAGTFNKCWQICPASLLLTMLSLSAFLLPSNLVVLLLSWARMSLHDMCQCFRIAIGPFNGLRSYDDARNHYTNNSETLTLCTRSASIEQCQVVVFIADDLGFLGPGSPDLMTELCPPQDTA